MRRPFFFVLAIVVPLLLYVRTATFDFVRADDADLIGGNQAFLSDIRNLPQAFRRSYFETENVVTDLKTYYRPVTIASFMIDAQRGGAGPSAYHATNVALHAAVSALVLALARRWGAAPGAALAATVLFAVHPLNMQAVAWIAGRNDLLVALFGLVSLLAWSRASDARERFGVASCAVHVVSFALALFSKESGLAVPLLAVGYTVGVMRAPVSGRLRAALTADVAVVVVWGVLRAHALEGSMAGLPPVESLQMAAANLPHLIVHAGKVVLPVRLNVSPGVDGPGLLLGVVGFGALAAIALRSLPGRWSAFAAAWGLLFLLPTLTVPDLPAYEHRMYLPLVGVTLAFARSRFERPVQVAIVCLVSSIFAAQAYARQEVFRDPFSYWSDATRHRPFAPIAHVNLGQLEAEAGRPSEARRHYLRALELDPDTPKAHNNLGVALMALGEDEAAERQFRLEVEQHPANAEAWFNLGLYADLHGRPDEAARFWERAIETNRYFVPAYEKLAAHYEALGDKMRARQYRESAATLRR